MGITYKSKKVSSNGRRCRDIQLSTWKMRILIKPLKVNVKIKLNREHIHGVVMGVQKVF